MSVRDRGRTEGASSTVVFSRRPSVIDGRPLWRENGAISPPRFVRSKSRGTGEKRREERVNIVEKEERNA